MREKTPAAVPLAQVDFVGLVPLPGESRAERDRWIAGDGVALSIDVCAGCVRATSPGGSVVVPLARVAWAVPA